MAVRLTKNVKREMLSFADTHGRNRGKPIIVELLAGDEISFRVKGTRTAYTTYLGHCFRLAQIQTIEENYKKAMEDYTAKKKAGFKRLRKPRRAALPYSKVYFQALNKG